MNDSSSFGCMRSALVYYDDLYMYHDKADVK